MVAHRSTAGIAIPADLLPTVLADGDAATTVGPGLRAGTTLADTETLHDAVQLAQQFRAFGFTSGDFDQFVDAFSAPDPATVFAHWADHEHRTGIRRAILAALVTVEEAR
ncbi:hypothetical protein P3T35_003023 [Kitasatospora sp. GP30]|uniref:hypothetical protein n=1 Tax=Kitasatospora sp. GP30 TaxID=3035084 RepID=UPI000CB67698|nr:hypothetical protein [Kitasatospora sp. GP30]MDH6141010.1 hypothetical protein [Kitasatospora sp. GP30]